jgi:hypothetical protein
MPTLDQQSFETQDSGAVTDQQIGHSGVELLVERCLELGLTQELANQLEASGEPIARDGARSCGAAVLAALGPGPWSALGAR